MLQGHGLLHRKEEGSSMYKPSWPLGQRRALPLRKPFDHHQLMPFHLPSIHHNLQLAPFLPPSSWHGLLLAPVAFLYLAAGDGDDVTFAEGGRGGAGGAELCPRQWAGGGRGDRAWRTWDGLGRACCFPGGQPGRFCHHAVYAMSRHSA